MRESNLAEVTSSLAAQGIESSGLALDLILHDIAQRAQQATGATGAAIALEREDEIICRARTGETTPDLGVRINTESGLSGACVRSGEMQWCRDTESDTRVDAEACRRLGVRSIIVVPLFDGQRLVGVFEIFSPQPNAFSEHDLQTLGGLAERAAGEIQRTPGKAVESQPDPIVWAAIPDLHRADVESASTELEGASEKPVASVPAANPRVTKFPNLSTPTLAVVVGILAVLCVLLIFHWRSPRAHSARIAATLQNTEPTSQSGRWEISSAQQQTAGSSLGSAQGLPATTIKRPTAAGKKQEVVSDEGDVVVYHNDSVVYGETPATGEQTKAPGKAESNGSEQPTGSKFNSAEKPPLSPTTTREAALTPLASANSSTAPAGGTASEPASEPVVPPPMTSGAATGLVSFSQPPSVVAPVRISQGVTEGRLVHRVDPKYPMEAVQKHLVGSVVLQARIGKDGLVRDLKPLRGDPILIRSALEAVRQWRFEPYRLNGEPVEMPTDITIKFSLPQ